MTNLVKKSRLKTHLGCMPHLAVGLELELQAKNVEFNMHTLGGQSQNRTCSLCMCSKTTSKIQCVIIKNIYEACSFAPRIIYNFDGWLQEEPVTVALWQSV